MLKCLTHKSLASLVLLIVVSQSAFAEQMVNVAIASSSKSLTVSGGSIRLYTAKEKLFETAGEFEITLKGKQLKVSGSLLEAPLRLLSAGPISVAGKKFRGELDIVIDQVNGSTVMTFVHPIDLETYVAGIVASEMPAAWPEEALKAQAIASRTYAIWQKYKRIDKSYHLDASVLDQVYGGLDKDHRRADKAAQVTAGVVLTYDEKPIKAYFSSSCGGKTESALEGWGSELGYLPGSTCGYCNVNNSTKWTYKVPKKTFEKIFGEYRYKGSLNAQIKGYTGSGRAKNIEVSLGRKKKEIRATDLRQRLGYSNLRSTLIRDIDVTSKEVVFHGTGYGHGVGMCQWGANGMAQAGYVAPEILARYYPGTELRRMY